MRCVYWCYQLDISHDLWGKNEVVGNHPNFSWGASLHSRVCYSLSSRSRTGKVCCILSYCIPVLIEELALMMDTTVWLFRMYSTWYRPLLCPVWTTTWGAKWVSSLRFMKKTIFQWLMVLSTASFTIYFFSFQFLHRYLYFFCCSFMGFGLACKVSCLISKMMSPF